MPNIPDSKYIPPHVKAAFTTIERYNHQVRYELAVARDSMLNDEEQIALLDVMTKNGR